MLNKSKLRKKVSEHMGAFPLDKWQREMIKKGVDKMTRKELVTALRNAQKVLTLLPAALEAANRILQGKKRKP